MATATKIKILIVDDHDMVRYGLTALLETLPDFEIVGHTGDAQSILPLCNKYQPDVVLMDLLMPRISGLDATQLILGKFPHIKVVALTSSVDEKCVRETLQAGVIGYILKTDPVDQLAQAVRAAFRGQQTLSSDAAYALISSLNTPKLNKMNYELSKQEQVVLSLLMKGFTNHEIAQQLVVTLSTVKAHVSHILAKLNANNRSHAIAIALRDQILGNAN